MLKEETSEILFSKKLKEETRIRLVGFSLS